LCAIAPPATFPSHPSALHSTQLALFGSNKVLYTPFDSTWAVFFPCLSWDK
jgi:hypothetical protein